MTYDIKILSFFQKTQIDTKSDQAAAVLCLSPYFMLLREREKIQLAFRDQLKYHIYLLLLYLLAQVLSPCNMHSRFSALLWLEELHAESEMREFTISGALLRKGAGYLHLDVPGLAEGRPSLNIGEEALGVFLYHC